MIIYLDQPSSLRAEDKLAASPWIARDHFCWPGIVFQRDSLKCLINCHLHTQVEKLWVPVSHPEPADEPQDDLLAGGVRGYHDRLVCKMRSQTCGIHSYGAGNREGVKTIYITDIWIFYFPLVLPLTHGKSIMVPW